MRLSAAMPLLLVTFWVALAPGRGSAADKPKFRDQVTAIDATSITLYRSPTKDEKFTVTSNTKVIVDYKSAKIEDVKLGMRAVVTHKADSNEATSINARTVK